MTTPTAATAEEVTAAVRGHTVPSRFAETVAARAGEVALRWKEGEGWGQWTWAEYADQVARAAAGLQRLGVGRGDRVVLMLRNRPEFHVADLALLLLGATPVSIYNSSAPDQVRYVASHCGATAAIAEDVGFLERFLKVRSELPELRSLVIVTDPEGLAPSEVPLFASLLEAPPLDLRSASSVAQPDDPATIIYTSGTTGPPKGVVLTHFNVLWTNESFRRCLPSPWTGKRFISYLPMAHIAERMTTLYDHIVFGSEVTTCPDPTQVGAYLREVRPDVFFGPPRIWEKLHAGISATLAADAEKNAAFRAALDVGRRAAEFRVGGNPLPADLEAEWRTLRSGVFEPVLRLVGLDRAELAITGSAPIPTEVVHFFLWMGLPISEIYGLSETCGPHTWEPLRVRPGTVGPPMPGCEVRFADDGEILLRGGNIFVGYLNDPDKTSEALDQEGWLHTGDIGFLDEAGYLKIIDRKKELIITAGGKNVSPANVEAALKTISLVGQACVVGEAKPYLVALLVLDSEVAPAWAKGRGILFASLVDLAAHPMVLAEVERGIEEANQGFSRPEQVKRFLVLGDEWSPDSDALTPTMKLKRRAILTRYAAEVESLYG